MPIIGFSVKMQNMVLIMSCCLLILFIFLVNRPAGADGSALFPLTRDRDMLGRLHRFFDPFGVLEHLPVGLERDELVTSPARVDWKETSRGDHLITLDVPGFKKDELKIETIEAERLLRVIGERNQSREMELQQEEEEHWHCAERSYGKFMRQFRLPGSVDMDSISAKMEKGVLAISIPKLPSDQVRLKGPKVVPIAAAGEERAPAVSNKLDTAAEVNEEL